MRLLPDWSELIGGSGAAKQLLIYGVGYEVVRALLGPAFTQIEYDINQRQPLVELSPAELADMVNRGIQPNDSTTSDRAAKFGLNADNFKALVDSAGEPPGLETILEWWRRGYLPWDDGQTGTATVVNAIRTSRIYPYWTDTIQKAQFVPPSPAEAVNAVLRNQIPLEQGIALAYFAGLGVSSLEVPPGADTSDTEQAFTILLDTAGSPPALTELAELVHRGIIPVDGTGPDALTFQQGIHEGNLKDKWEKPLEAFLEVIPSIYEIRILQEHGAITNDQASQWLSSLGYTADVASALAADATNQVITTDKQATEGTIVDLYKEKFLTADQAGQFLEALGYTAEAVSFVLANADLSYALNALNSAVTRIGGYFIAHKLTSDQTNQALLALQLSPDQITALIQTWTIEQTSNIKLPTEAQITDAWTYGIIDEPTALTSLEALGYTPYDAWLVLSVKNKGPLPNPPAQGPAGIVPSG